MEGEDDIEVKVTSTVGNDREEIDKDQDPSTMKIQKDLPKIETDFQNEGMLAVKKPHQIGIRSSFNLGDMHLEVDEKLYDPKSPIFKKNNSDPTNSPRPEVDNNNDEYSKPITPKEEQKRVTSSKSKSRRNKEIKGSKDRREYKEMDWFVFENRVREIVRDILEPYAIKSVDIQESVKVLSDAHDKFKRKQDEMEFVMHKRNHRNSGIDELNKKIFDIENERKVRDARNMQQLEALKVQLAATQDRMTQIEELSLTFKKQADDIKHEINGFFDQLTKFQEKFSKDQLKYKEDMNKNFLTLRNQYLKTEELSKINKNYINNHFEELKRHDMIVQSYQKNFNELYKKLQTLDKIKIDTTQFNDEVSKIKKDITHVRFLNEDVFQSVQLIDNYIEEFIPMKIEKMLKEFTSKMHTDNDSISPIYRYKMLFSKRKPDEEIKEEEELSDDKPEESSNVTTTQPKNDITETKENEESLQQFNHGGKPELPQNMIDKYKNLTGNLEEQKLELEELEKKELERIDKMIKEEDETELDADKILDYLLNVVAYLEEDLTSVEKGKRKFARKSNLRSKELLKKRFADAGFSSEALSRRYTVSDKDSKSIKRAEYKQSSGKVQSVMSGPVLGVENKGEEQKEALSLSLPKSTLNYQEGENHQKSSKYDGETVQKQSSHKLVRDYDIDAIDHRKLKIDDLEEETAELILKALDDVKDMKDKMETQRSIIEESVRNQEIFKMQMQKYVENVQKDLEDVLVKRNRDKANINLKHNTIDARIDKIFSNMKEFQEISDNLSQVVNYLVENAQINYAMELQDEIDREKLALMGYKEESDRLSKEVRKAKSPVEDNSNPYVTLDKQCLTCSGQSSVVLKAFKIACLTYKPSPVNFPFKLDKTYSRLELINLKGKMLKFIEKVPLTKEMRGGNDPESERIKIFNQYISTSISKFSNQDGSSINLLHTRLPKITIRNESLLGVDSSLPLSPTEIKKRNISVLNEYKETKSRNINSVSMKSKNKESNDGTESFLESHTVKMSQFKRGSQTSR